MLTTKVGCVSDSVTHHPRLNQNCRLLNLRSIKTTSANSFLLHLKTIGTWSGNDFEECLEAVQNSQGQAQFNYDSNPFD
jgi:hypothetical protein